MLVPLVIIFSGGLKTKVYSSASKAEHAFTMVQLLSWGGGGWGGGGEQVFYLVAKQAVEFPQVLTSMYEFSFKCASRFRTVCSCIRMYLYYLR